MKNEMYAELMHAASLLTKAASKLEYSDNLHKEASATAEALVSRGIANADQRDFYKDYLSQNPEKIASIKTSLNDLPVSVNGALGEVVGGYEREGGLDDFDRAVLG